MFTAFYQRYKIGFWALMTLLFASGAVSKSAHGSQWEVYLNGGLGAVCLIMAVVSFIQQKSKNNEQNQ